MIFDIRSLLVAVALASVFSAGARLLLWRMHPTISGLGHWALAGGTAAFAFILIIFYGITHWSASLALAQIVVVLGLVVVWDGFRRFIGKTPLSPLALLILAIIVLAWVSSAQIQQSLLIRALGNSILVASLSALIAYELLSIAKPIPAAMRVTGWLYASNACVFIIRIIASDTNSTPIGPLNPDGFAAFMLLWWLCMTIAVTLGMVLMTTERLQSNLDYQANHDPLTGALNRRAFSLIADNALAHSRRSNTPLSILMIDLDHFKKINDQLGHNAGDTLLCQFVTTANNVLRDQDVFCRFGGEEFVALLPNTSADMAMIAAERLRTAFTAETASLEKLSTVTISTGISELMQDEKIDSLLGRADKALYIAKNNGRNCSELFVT